VFPKRAKKVRKRKITGYEIDLGVDGSLRLTFVGGTGFFTLSREDAAELGAALTAASKEGRVASDVFDEFREEQETHADRGYTFEHDQEHGIAHLTKEVIYRLSHSGEVSSPEAIRHTFVVAGSLLGAAVKVIDAELASDQKDEG
jgi:hypothetical protein